MALASSVTTKPCSLAACKASHKAWAGNSWGVCANHRPSLSTVSCAAAGSAGLLRFPDPASRLHALTKADHLGLGFIVLGLLPQMGSLGGALRLMAIWMLVLLASAATGPMIAALIRRQGQAE